jgi:hypothetical protein
MYKIVETDVDVEIEFEDVMEYINCHASDSEIAEILEEISEPAKEQKSNSGLEGSYVIEEKMTLLNLAAKKYTLEELERKLGNKFDLM